MRNRVVPFRPGKKAAVRRYVNFRRVMAMQQLPITSLGRDMLRVAPASSQAYWVAMIRVATRNLSTCSTREQESALHHLFRFLNGRDDSFQWRFSSRPVDPQRLIATIEQRMKEIPAEDERRLWLLDQRQHLQTLVRVNNIPEAGLYLVIRTAHPKGMEMKEAWNHAAQRLQHLCSRAISDLHGIGVEARRLETAEMVAVLWADLNPDLVQTHKTPPEYHSLVTMGKPERLDLYMSQDYIGVDDPLSPSGQTFMDAIAPLDLEFQRDCMMINRMYRTVLCVRGWPTYLQYNALRHLTNCQLNMDISIHVRPVDTADALRFLDERIRTLTVASAKDEFEGYAQDHRVIKFKEQAVYCREQLEQGHLRWFFTSMYVAVTADTPEQLREDVRTVEAMLNQAEIKAAPAFRQQKEGLLACLPLCYDPVEATRNMLTDAVANLAPIDSQQSLHPTGMYAGISRLNNSLICLDFWALKNYNIVIMGNPGSGKTVCMRTKIQHIHTMTDDHQIIGDPDGEMDAMVHEMGGRVARLGGSSHHRINIMDLALDWDDQKHGHSRGRPMDKMVPLLTSWLEYQIGTPGADGVRRFDPVQKAHVMHAIVRAYGRFGITPENQADIVEGGKYRWQAMPTLGDLREELGRLESDLAEAMGLFDFGPMQMFNAHTNIDLSGARLISLNLRDLDPATRNMAMTWIVNWMWGRVGLNRLHKRNTHLYFEEILWFLEEPIAAQYISMIWTRGRKWRCCPTAVSQLLERLMATPVGRTIVKTSDLKVLFDQGEALPEVKELLDLSEAEASFVRGSGPGHGLYVNGPHRLPFTLLLSEHQYEFFTTKPGEMREV